MQVLFVIFVPRHFYVAGSEPVVPVGSKSLSFHSEKKPVTAVADQTDQAKPEYPGKQRADPAESPKQEHSYKYKADRSKDKFDDVHSVTSDQMFIRNRGVEVRTFFGRVV